MSGRGRSTRDHVPVKEYFPDPEPVVEPKVVEPSEFNLLAVQFSTLAQEYSALRKENNELRKQLTGGLVENAEKVEKKVKDRKDRKDRNTQPREYDVFVKNKVAEFKVENPGMKYMELRALANAEWKKHKENKKESSESEKSEESDN